MSADTSSVRTEEHAVAMMYCNFRTRICLRCFPLPNLFSWIFAWRSVKKEQRMFTEVTRCCIDRSQISCMMTSTIWKSDSWWTVCPPGRTRDRYWYPQATRLELWTEQKQVQNNADSRYQSDACRSQQSRAIYHEPTLRKSPWWKITTFP